LALTYFSAIMKLCKKEKEQQVSEEHNLFLQRLRDENNALIKLIKQLEERDPSKSKPADNQNQEGSTTG
jgi:hypothetical protein